VSVLRSIHNMLWLENQQEVQYCLSSTLTLTLSAQKQPIGVIQTLRTCRAFEMPALEGLAPSFGPKSVWESVQSPLWPLITLLLGGHEYH